jgi:hypothetical protein
MLSTVWTDNRSVPATRFEDEAAFLRRKLERKVAVRQRAAEHILHLLSLPRDVKGTALPNKGVAPYHPTVYVTPGRSRASA